MCSFHFSCPTKKVRRTFTCIYFLLKHANESEKIYIWHVRVQVFAQTSQAKTCFFRVSASFSGSPCTAAFSWPFSFLPCLQSERPSWQAMMRKCHQSLSCFTFMNRGAVFGFGRFVPQGPLTHLEVDVLLQWDSSALSCHQNHQTSHPVSFLSPGSASSEAFSLSCSEPVNHVALF